jgi:hypothetical protein
MALVSLESVQRFAIVARAVEIAMPPELRVQPLLLAVLVCFVVLLTILHEAALAAERRPDPLLQQTYDFRLLVRSRLQLREDLAAGLPAMIPFRVVLWSGLVRLAISHLLSVV